MTRIIVDCDPGHDDAIALMLALASPEVTLVGVTTVAGNQTVQVTTANAIRVLEYLGAADVPVAAGAGAPLTGRVRPSTDVHGESGLDGAELPPPRAAALAEHAVEWVAGVLGDHAPGSLVLVALGPLTNVALLQRRHPGAAARIGRIVMMGGALARGNATAAAEFNVWSDPEAAQIVLDGATPVAMVGLDVTSRALVDGELIERWAAGGSAARLAARLCRFRAGVHERRRGVAAAPVHDAVAMAHVIDPGLLTMRRVAVEVATAGEERGRTFAVAGGDGRCEVAVDIDVDRFLGLLQTRIEALP